MCIMAVLKSSTWKQMLFLILVFSISAHLVESQFYTCPEVDNENVGICSEECSQDSDCPDGDSHKCCYNGCGHVCLTATETPYHPPPLECPEVDPEVSGICSEECNETDGCGNEGELCCSNGCGHVCTRGVVPDPLCAFVRETIMNSSLIGAYVPQCEDDGTFSQVQCHGSTGYCWCVANDTGEPVTGMQRFNIPVCNCTYEGRGFNAGDTFQSLEEDDCDICFCTVDGGVSCTPRDCEGENDEESDSNGDSDSDSDSDGEEFYSCPAARVGSSSLCSADCLLHSECPDPPTSKCCYNGCGYSCTKPHRIPYIDLSSAHRAQCPDVSDVPCVETTGSCTEEEFACDEETEICCENSCGISVCVTTELDSPCVAAVKIAINSSDGRIGGYKPQCTGEGLFREIQCHEHYCWCVNPESGVPMSEIVPFEKTNLLTCAECVYNGVKYRHLESFPSGIDCNTCKCIGGAVGCSSVECDESDRFSGDEDDEDWEWWHSLLIGCVIVVVVLVSIVLALLVGIVILMRQNSPHRHQILKEVKEDQECEMVEYCAGPESVELKVPMEDTTVLNHSDRDPVMA